MAMHAQGRVAAVKSPLARGTSTGNANYSLQAGVGCFVLNEHQHVLMVQEGNGPLRGKGTLQAPLIVRYRP